MTDDKKWSILIMAQEAKKTDSFGTYSFIHVFIHSFLFNKKYLEPLYTRQIEYSQWEGTDILKKLGKTWGVSRYFPTQCQTSDHQADDPASKIQANKDQ